MDKMMSKQTPYRNFATKELFLEQSTNQSSAIFQKQRPKPPARQMRQNSTPYFTLQSPPSRSTVHVANAIKPGTPPKDDWFFQPFEVPVKRNSLGLGLSITGGPDAKFPFSKLIRVKKVFPLQPAWETGRLSPGDIILSVGGLPLSGLTIRQAIDILRSNRSGEVTSLVLCKPPPDNHPRHLFDELFNNTNSDNENKATERKTKPSVPEKAKIIQRSFSTCISTSGNDNRISQSGTPSKGPLSISLFPNHQSTTVFCTTPAKPKRNTPETLQTKTTIGNHENDVTMSVSKHVNTKIDTNEARNNSPMDFEDNSSVLETNLSFDDSVQSFTHCNGVNGPVFVDNSPERENGITTSSNSATENYLQMHNHRHSSRNIENNHTNTSNQFKASTENMPAECNEETKGEFSIRIRKINGSLGFTLCQAEDSSSLRHTIKALVKEPALSDGRIRPGDKLLSANGTNCAALSHTELIAFLRKIGNRVSSPNGNNEITSDEIELRLFRNSESPQRQVYSPDRNIKEEDGLRLLPPQSKSNMTTKSHPNLPSYLNSSNFISNNISSSNTPRRLRQEAKEMVRSLQASRSSLDGNTNNNTSTNGNIFHSSRNGSNASASSSSGGNRYKRHLISRPYSPAALVTNQCGKTDAYLQDSTYMPDHSYNFTKHDEPISWSCGDENPIRRSIISKKDTTDNMEGEIVKVDSKLRPPSASHSQNIHSDMNLHFNNFEQSQQSGVLINQNNVRNRLYNIDLTNEKLQKLQIENYIEKGGKPDIMKNANSMPPLTKFKTSYNKFDSENLIPDGRSAVQVVGETSSINTNAVRLVNGQSQGMQHSDLLKDNRKAQAYVFHTFGYKSDTSH